ncbi:MULTISPECIES: MBL fold metallo-hydrolase [Paenibacillus]|uniref:MBL fold metallo-hydrolase n=1 Tax=Paenibacillus residui TaxID=629724 RepID=A0ABW3D9U9_9BACL|nr:MBL fold metallo-hydrolase [Paenibacillus sp. 32O-W]
MSMKLPEVSADAPQCELTVLNAGFYRASLNMLHKERPRQQIWGPALFFLIRHPKNGYFLFDTGYSTRFREATRLVPYRLMRLATPVRITEQEHALVQLQAMGVEPDEVTVILSHMHVDHTGGIHDFPRSQIIVNKVEWEFTQGRSPLRLFPHAYLSSLFNQIDPNRVRLIDFDSSSGYGPLPQAVDLLGDESLVLVPLPGHSVGQMGLLINHTRQGRVLLCADAVYMQDNYRDRLAGSRISRIAHYDYSQYLSQFALLHDLEKENSGLTILPSHDPGVYERYVLGKGRAGQ